MIARRGRTAVDKVGRGKQRQVNTRFSALASRFLFEAEFCNPASGQEKGQIERNVRDARHRLWQPTPSFPSLEALNDWLEARCRDLWGVTPHSSQSGSISDVRAAEVRHPMPRAFDGFAECSKRVSPTCLTSPNGSILKALSNDAVTQHGRRPVFALVDELHAWKKPDLWQMIRTGLVKTPDSLLIVTTTAGRAQEYLAAKIVDYARKAARGDLIDPSFLPILYETPSDADWRDEAVWKAANSGLAHGYPDLEGLRQLAREAEQRPADREAFKQLHLNIWADHSSAPFVEMATYDEGGKPFDLAEMEHQPCWLGVDVSSNSDLTAVVACWRDRDKEGGYRVVPWFFYPEDNLDKRTQQPAASPTRTLPHSSKSRRSGRFWAKCPLPLRLHHTGKGSRPMSFTPAPDQGAWLPGH